MKTWIALALVAACAGPALAQPHTIQITVDAEGVRRTGQSRDYAPNTTRFEPEFRTGGGLGIGLRWFMSDHAALEVKGAGLVSKMRVRTTGSDFVAIADLGNVQIYPLTAVLQWHMTEHGSLRPYIGAGVEHVILRNINRSFGPATGIHFDDPTGLVLNGGLLWELSKRWALSGDVRYMPIETSSRASFPGTQASVDLNVRPLVVGFGLACRY